MVVIWVWQRKAWQGLISYSLAGAVVLLLSNCAISPLMWKPSWIEDQTYREAFFIAAQRQDLSFALSGVAFGALFWYSTERYPRLRS